jgi:hypothetical protein
MGLLPDRAASIQTLLSRLLDKGYADATGAVVRAIAQNSMSGIIKTRLAQLDAECARLAAEGLKLEANNPVLRALVADFQESQRANAALMNSAAGPLQESGMNAAGPVTRQLALPGLTDQQLQVLGIRWNVPNPDAVAQVVRYAGSPEWAALLTQYQADVTEAVLNAALRGIVAGQGPLTTARQIRDLVEGLPLHQANNLMRTLQLTSYRDAQVLHRVANAGILDYQIRIAALQPGVTCVACVALHGTRMELGERVNDHHQGRCTSITALKGRPAPDIETGEDWFNRQSPETQETMMGGAAYRAWQAGSVQLKDFPQTYNDPVFGEMIRESSLVGMLGDDAEQYYARNQ